MVDVEQQIKAWADAAAPPVDERVEAADVIAGRANPTNVIPIHAGPNRGRWLAAAAAVLVVGAIGVGLVLGADDGPEQVRASEPETTTTVDGPTTTSVEVAPPTGPVTFEELGSSGDGAAVVGALASVQTPTELSALWASSMRGLPLPEVEWSKQVVVSMTIAPDGCPPSLIGFARSGDAIRPRFLVPGESCEGPAVPMTFVVALDWASVGDSFLLTVINDVDGDDQQETLRVTRQGAGSGAETGTPGSGVTATLEVGSTTIGSGEGEGGTITVVNDSGAPIEGTSCGGYFVAYLEGPAYTQAVVRPACAMHFTIPEGTSTYPVEIQAIFSTCSASEQSPGGEPPCEPDGSLPGLPPGDYQLRIDDPQDLVPTLDPITITVT